MPELIDTQTPVGSAEWWLKRLSTKLDARQADIQLYDDYYSGKHNLVYASRKFREAFRGSLEQFADNWCDLVVDAVEERLNVEGFRLGDDTAGDRDAWRIWQANQLDADSQIAHTEVLKSVYCYVLVGPGTDDTPEITVEDPRQAVVAYEPGSRRRRAAALKRWQDDTGLWMATVYLPDAIYKFQTKAPMPGELTSAEGVQWVPRETDREPWPLRNPLRAVPMVEFVNKPKLDGTGESEIAKVIPIQNAVNKLGIDLLFASEFAAFRQRYVTGMDIPVDDAGNPVRPFDVGVDRILMSENPETRFGEFSESNLENYVKAIQMWVQHIASQTRTPPHYFYLKGEFPSGESIKSAETGLVAKARRKMRHNGERWEEVIRLAFAVLDDPRAGVTDSETIWGDPESRSESEHIDAVVKKQALGIPQEQLWEDAGYSPQQIARFRTMQDAEALRVGQVFDPFTSAG